MGKDNTQADFIRRDAETHLLKGRIRKMDQEIRSLKRKFARARLNPQELFDDGKELTETTFGGTNGGSEIEDSYNKMTDSQLNGMDSEDMDLDEDKFNMDDLDVKDLDILRIKNEEIEQIKKDYEQQIEAITLKVNEKSIYFFFSPFLGPVYEPTRVP